MNGNRARAAAAFASVVVGLTLLVRAAVLVHAETYPGSNWTVRARVCTPNPSPPPGFDCTTPGDYYVQPVQLESYVPNSDSREWPQTSSVYSLCHLNPSPAALQEALGYGALLIRTNVMYRLHNPKWPDSDTDENDQAYDNRLPTFPEDGTAGSRTFSQRLEVSAVTQFISFGSQTQCNSVQWAMNGLDYVQMADQQYPASPSYDLRSSGEGVDLYSPWWLAVDGRAIGDEALYITNPSGVTIWVHVWAGKNGGCNNCQGDAFSQDISIPGSSTYTLRMPGISGPQVHVHSNDGTSPVFAEQWIQATSGAYSTFQLVPSQNFASAEHLPIYSPANALAANIPIYNPSGNAVTVQVTGPGVNQSYTINAWSTYLAQVTPSATGPITIQATSPPGAIIQAAEASYQVFGSGNFWWMVPAQPRVTASTDEYFPWYANSGQQTNSVAVYVANPGPSPITFQLWANKSSQCYTQATIQPGQTQGVFCPRGSGPEIHVVSSGGPVVASVRETQTAGFWQDQPMLARRSLSPTVWSPYVTGSSSNPQSFVMFYNPNIPDYSGSGGLSGQPYLNWSPINSLSLPAFSATYQQYAGGGTVWTKSTNALQADLLQSEWACVQNCTYFFSTLGASK